VDNFDYGFDEAAQARWDERIDVLRNAGVPAAQAVALADFEPDCELREWLARVNALLTI
jgi:hypothetical protein